VIPGSNDPLAVVLDQHAVLMALWRGVQLHPGATLPVGNREPGTSPARWRVVRITDRETHPAGRALPPDGSIPTVPGLVRHPKGRAVLRPMVPLVVQPGGGDVGVAQPLLHFGDVRIMRERVGGRRRSQGMHAEALHVLMDTYLPPLSRGCDLLRYV